MGFLRLHFLCPCLATHNTFPFFPSLFLCKLGKNQWPLSAYFWDQNDLTSDRRGQGKIEIMRDRKSMKVMKAGEILVYTNKIYTHIPIKYSCRKGRICAGIDLDRSMKTFRFKNLGLDRLLGDSEKFGWHFQGDNNKLFITYTCLNSWHKERFFIQVFQIYIYIYIYIFNIYI